VLENLGPVEIMKYQQNRHPLLYLDLVLLAEPGKRATAIKNFSYNEWFFPAHFQDEPVVPGFILIEALTQTFLMTFLTDSSLAGRKTAFVEISQAKFMKKVIPGDQLLIEARLDSINHGLAKGFVTSSVNEIEVCAMSLSIAIPDILNARLPKSKGKA
jgi:3-hydroxyacyl-[acyl-carrier-protein] dehydratase